MTRPAAIVTTCQVPFPPLPSTRGRYASRAGTDTSSVWAAFHWARVAPNPVRAGPGFVPAAAGEDGGAGLDGEGLGCATAAGALGSVAGLAPTQPESIRTAANALAAVKDFAEGRRAAGRAGFTAPATRGARVRGRENPSGSVRVRRAG